MARVLDEPDGLLAPDDLPTWVPGDLTVLSPDDWRGPVVRGYRYRGSDVEVPPMRDFMIVAYRRGVTNMRRRIDGDWLTETLRPGDVSLLTRAADSHWVWPGDVEVVHVYLSKAELTATCREMYDRDVVDVELRDELKADDPDIHRISMAIAEEAARGGAGSRLVVDALACELSVHILRRHARVLFREAHDDAGLGFVQERAVRDYVEAHLAEPMSLDELAAQAGLSRGFFARRFRRSLGTSPHEYVVTRRVSRARALLERTDVPLVDVAASCGFADQSHLTREFRKRVGTTPGRYRSRR
jgi:AraC family transcriptional regulator